MKNKYVTFVLPCLNEANNIDEVVSRIKKTFKENNIKGEIIVSDNGSTDGSRELAKKAGAKVFVTEKRGYGNAYLNMFVDNIDKIKDGYIFMADSDNTYEYEAIPRFIEKLDEGYEFVIGNRFPLMQKGAMPLMNKYIGNPILTGMFNLFFAIKNPIRDVHCGMRGFTKDAIKKMNLKYEGMEFASEMVLKALRKKLKITQVDIKYFPRLGDPSKLNPFRDAWRHVKFMFIHTPTWLFFIPGLILLIFGFFFQFYFILADYFNLPQSLFGVNIYVIPSIFGAAIALTGFQIISLGLFANTYAFSKGLEESDAFFRFLKKFININRSIFLGILLCTVSLILISYLINKWIAMGYQFAGNGDQEVRMATFSITLFLLGIQIMFSSFFMKVLNK